MAKIKFMDNEIETSGDLPEVGTEAPNFELVRNDLSLVNFDTYKGMRKILNIFPSIDTPVCATSVLTFHKQATSMDNVVVLNISEDLPFAQSRFCATEGLEKAETVSCFRDSCSFKADYGVGIVQGPLEGLCSRAVVILDEEDKVIYAEQVPDLSHEPNYAAALEALKGE